MPGPLLAVTLKESISRGKWSALWLSSGHAFCELILVIALAAGLTRFISGNMVAGPIGLLGGVILIWMGIGALKAPSYEAKDATLTRRKGRGLVFTGSAVTVSNPYWSIWWLMAAPALLLWSANQAGTAGIAAFYVGHILSDFLWFGIVGFAAGSGRRFLEGRPYRVAIRGCGIFLLFFGVYFVGYGGKILHSAFLR